MEEAWRCGLHTFLIVEHCALSVNDLIHEDRIASPKVIIFQRMIMNL